MGAVIAFSNQKGGVGKTTLTRELGLYLASRGKSVLVIDLDPQANLTRSLTDEEHPGSYEALSGLAYHIQKMAITPFGGGEHSEPGARCGGSRKDREGPGAVSGGGLSLLAGDIRMAMLEKSLIAEIDAYTRLKELLGRDAFRLPGGVEAFEYILIDSPPSLGVLTVNALTAAEYIIIPMNPSLYSMQGTNDLMATVQKVKKSLNPGLKLLGVIINAFDRVPVITRQIKDEIERSFGDKVFTSVVSKSIRIEEAIARRDGIVSLQRGKIKDEIIHVGEELVGRLSGASGASGTGVSLVPPALSEVSGAGVPVPSGAEVLVSSGAEILVPSGAET